MSGEGQSTFQRHWRWWVGGSGLAGIAFISGIFMIAGQDPVTGQSGAMAQFAGNPGSTNTPDADAQAQEDVAPDDVEPTGASTAASPDADAMTDTRYSKDLLAVLNRLGLPLDHRNADEECSSQSAINTAVTSYQVCNDVQTSPCVFSSDDRCSVNMSLVDGKVHGITYSYDAEQFSPPQTKSVLDNQFGKVRWDVKPVLRFPDGSWMAGRTADWKSGSIRIVLMLMAGRRSDDTRYMTGSLIVSDKDVPDPFSKK